MAAGGSGRRGGGSNPSRPQSVSLNCVASDGCPELNKRSGGRADGRGDTRPSSVYPTGPSWLETSSRPPPLSSWSMCKQKRWGNEMKKSFSQWRWKSRWHQPAKTKHNVPTVTDGKIKPPRSIVTFVLVFLGNVQSWPLLVLVCERVMSCRGFIHSLRLCKEKPVDYVSISVDFELISKCSPSRWIIVNRHQLDP